MTNKAQGKTMAILAADGFEEIELTSPRQAVEYQGGKTEIISMKSGEIQSNKHRDRGDTFSVDKTLEQANVDDYDALLIPGGLFSPDALRTEEQALGFVNAFFQEKKPVFSICHGPQVLISTDAVKGRKMTAIAPIQKDLENAGAHVHDEAVIVDDGLVTSRSPDDLDAFNAKVVEELCEGAHEGQLQSV